ncbi:MAG: Uma2 family endonuclease [Marinilabiliaceae bacterium]|nr:Uma2 family endonuclease [Marinilabiliaceae bacterium]
MLTNINQLDLSKTYTYTDYLKWQFKTRVEIIMGKVFKMSPAPSPIHKEVVSALNAALYHFLKGKECKVFPAPFDVRLDNDESDIKTVVQPDLCVICDLAKIDARGCTGAPDLVIEIISPATARKDLHEKFDLYERSGVKEYWIIHPFERTLTMFVLQGNGKYKPEKPLTEGDIVVSHVIEGFQLNLSDTFPNRAEEPLENYNENRI